MFRISRRGAIIRASIIGAIVAAVSAFGLYSINQLSQVDAITGEGETITITDTNSFEYDDDNYTNHYWAVTSNGTTEAFCAQPSLDYPSGTTTAVRLANDNNTYNLIKLVIYIYQNDNAYANAARNDVFSAWSGEELYPWTHAIIGALYYNDYINISEANVTNINNAIAKLQNYINTDSSVWSIAKNYQLFMAPGYETGRQDVVWIEDNYSYGTISVQKCDSTTNSCSAQGGANFSGITFEVYNNSGSTIFNPKTNQFYASGDLVATGTTNSAGAVTFANLISSNITYLVKETATNSSYELTAGQQAAVLNGNGDAKTLYFYNNVVTGSITVNKTNSATGTCTTVGDASLNGTTFQVVNNSANAIYYNGTSIASGAVVDTKQLANGSCNVTFSNLPYGSYIVKETVAGPGYQIDTASRNVDIPTSGSTTISVNFSNTPIYGDITVNKIDAETGTCTTVGNLSFDGTTFQLINNSTSAIYYNGSSVAKGSIIDSKTLTGGACSVKFENLPYGSYIVKETATVEGYVLNTTPQNITIPTNSSVSVSTTIANQVIRGDVKFVKMDEANAKVMRDTIFSISAIDENDNLGETHIVISDHNGIVDTSSSFIRHSINTNGYDALYDGPNPVLFSGYGSWFGVDHNGNALPANDGLGALPYGTYVIQELKCGANLFCTNVMNQKATITIDTNNQVINLADWNNTCAKFSLDTEAVDAKDGDKFLEITSSSQKATIKDTISYCVKPNFSFTLKGILMDKNTGEPLLINGETVEQSMSLKSDTECGEVEMDFELDITGLAGKELVVFETLWYKDDIIIQHDDINDASQTVDIVSLTTYATNDATADKILPADEDTKIKDVVRYCLKPGLEYTIKGIVMNKTTGEKLLINGEAVEQEVKFTPETACGEFNMYYDVNTANLAGNKLVIFESLYLDDELIIDHHDINNADESVDIEDPIPAPETGFTTKDDAGSHGVGITVAVIAVSAVIVAGYYGKRALNRHAFLNRR